MIIRSQDKEAITTNLNIWISYDVVGCNIMNDDFSLGSYSTVEKAIKVLDMICEFYTEHLEEMNWETPPFVRGCFYMPQDSEV